MTCTTDELNSYIFPGSVLRLSNSNIHSVDPHYHVILNKTPLTDSDIVMVVASTNVLGRQKHAQKTGKSISTMPIFENKDCPFLSERSIFDGNSLCTYSLNALHAKYYCHEWDLKKSYSITPEVFSILREAVVKGSAAAYLKDLL